MTEHRRILDLVQPHLLDLAPYEAVEPPESMARRAGMPESELVKLNANENPYGPSPKVAEALANLHRAHLYPDPAQTVAREALSGFIGLDPAHIVIGNGSDEIIDLVFRAVLGPGDAVINCVPTFGMYDFTAHVCGGRTSAVERTPSFDVDVAAVERATRDGAKIIVIASPNNPSGNSTPIAEIERLLATGLLVMIDEAYVEFDGRSAASFVPDHENLVVLRTLSKWGGLAGLRVGYGLMATDLADLLLRAKPPYNVSQAAEAALLASLADVATLNDRARSIVEERGRMMGFLSETEGVDPLPSDANFILCHLPQGRGREAYDGLAQRGVFVRYYARGTLADYLRISVGTAEQTDRLMAALRDVLGG